MRTIFVALAALMTTVSSAFAASGPKDIIPAPVKYETLKEEYSPKLDGSDVRIHLGDKRFRKEINALNLADYARDEAYKLVVGRKGMPFPRPACSVPGQASG